VRNLQTEGVQMNTCKDPEQAMALTGPAELHSLAEQINEQHDKCKVALTAGVEHAIKAGTLLTEAKQRVGHGGWLAWIQDNCNFSQRTVQAYMRVARNAAMLEERNAQRVADLSFRQALRQLAEPTLSLTEQLDGALELLKTDGHDLEAAIRFGKCFDVVLKQGKQSLEEMREIDMNTLSIERCNATARTCLEWQNRFAEINFRLQRKMGKILLEVEAL